MPGASHNDTHPTHFFIATWKMGIKHDTKYGQLRLSKGFNLEELRSDFILVEYENHPDVHVENIQQVHTVWNGDEWELHLVGKNELPVGDAPCEKTVGIDLGIINYLTLD